MSSEEIFKKKKVCDAHFTERDRNRNHRLNNLAIPSLHLNGFHGKLTIATSATVAQKPEMDTQYVAGLNNQRDHSKATCSRTGTVEKMHIGCSSIIAHNAIAPAFTATDRTESQVQKMVPTGLNNQRDHSKATCSRTGTVEKMHIGCSSIIAHNAIAPAFTATDRTESQVQKMVPTGCCSEHFPVTVDHNYCKKAEKAKTSAQPSSVNANKYRTYQKKITNLRRDIYRLRKSGQSFKARLAQAEKLYRKSSYKKLIKDMTPQAKLFTSMQLQTKKKQKGRRFRLEEKVLSLSLFKRSPKCYALGPIFQCSDRQPDSVYSTDSEILNFSTVR
ncbi:uncharacterized protein LOC119691665 [Plutella xylostella]|uniref:uncharacterized protein LOC119691665 n=1 Tax=Plutella xylostella TaxID=51655 RepID=UPI00203279A4|nr:uncharacterized protein LOC119691665 [Plutella xylostella]